MIKYTLYIYEKVVLPMNVKFSDRISSLQPSAIREILKATAAPGIIPFAAGNPAPDAFPVEEVRRIAEEIMREHPIDALQYGVTEGFAPLRQRLVNYMKEKHNVGRAFDQLIITSGAQQVMDLATKVLCNEGDTVICENPSFIGSLNCFRSYNVKLCGIPVEADGMDMQRLEAALKTEKNVKFIYTIPNFQNPAGATMSLEKRQKLYSLAREYQVLILEDNPYGDLRVAGEHIPPVKSMDEEGLVIYAGSFSKILSPGLRVGYAIASSEIIAKMTVGKQTSDVHTPVFNQMIVNSWMEEYNMDAHIEKIRGIYRRKLNLMCDLMEEKLSGFFSYHRPEGGLFVWASIPQGIDMPGFVKTAVEHGVAMVPGTAFLTDESEPTQFVRLNFSTPSDEQIVSGMETLAKLTNAQ